MPSDVATAVRERLSGFSLVTWALTMAAIYVLTDSLGLLVVVTAAVVVTGTVDMLQGVPSVDERWVEVGFAVCLTVASIVWAWYELTHATPPGRLWLPALAVLGGFWLLLDARADFVQGRRFGDPDEFDDLDAGEAMLIMQHANLVADELRSGPKTVPELARRCDLTESRVREAIELAGRDETISRVGTGSVENPPRYALDERKMGLRGLGRQAAAGVSGLLRRVVRPFVDQF